MERPPNRLHVKAWHPDYDKAALDKRVEVFFNGIRQVNNVIHYDVEAGTIERYKKTALGRYVMDAKNEPIVETLTGDIVAKWRSEI